MLPLTALAGGKRSFRRGVPSRRACAPCARVSSLQRKDAFMLRLRTKLSLLPLKLLYVPPLGTGSRQVPNKIFYFSKMKMNAGFAATT